MTEPKKKRLLDLPDRQLARAFGFSAIDLAANRSGYMSLPQQFAFPPSWQPLLRWIVDWLPQRHMPKVDVIRARAQLQYAQYQTFAFQRADLREVFTVQFGTVTFKLTPKQYRTLMQDVMYDVYITNDSQTILSLERVIKVHPDFH
ncbi:MAG: hypothetical protein KC546_21265 [Anaerolineae bacterium]|nr:hypothetical protein [Anaerolineae bacterium]MCA9890927.1 hypothetical protein [Anaerolineae bacterium]MCB9458078.1 hypothetical protein [Anaerolineaceae bacterium]